MQPPIHFGFIQPPSRGISFEAIAPLARVLQGCSGMRYVVSSLPPSQDQVIHILLHPVHVAPNIAVNKVKMIKMVIILPDVGLMRQASFPSHSFFNPFKFGLSTAPAEQPAVIYRNIKVW